MSAVVAETERPCLQCGCEELTQNTTAGRCVGCGHNPSQHPRRLTVKGRATMEAEARYVKLAAEVKAEMHRQDERGYDKAHDEAHGLAHVLSIADTLIQVARAKGHAGELELSRKLALQSAATALKAIIQIDYLLGIADVLMSDTLPEIQEGDGH